MDGAVIPKGNSEQRKLSHWRFYMKHWKRQPDNPPQNLDAGPLELSFLSLKHDLGSHSASSDAPSLLNAPSNPPRAYLSLRTSQNLKL